jgi:phosphate starvation-inducible PhoH-like protein
MASTTLRFPTPRHLNQLYAGREENLILVERALGVQLVAREDWLKIDGTDADIARTEMLFGFLNDVRTQGVAIRTNDFTRIVETLARGEVDSLKQLFGEPLVITTQRKSIVPKTLGQKLYLQSMIRNPVGVRRRSRRHRQDIPGGCPWYQLVVKEQGTTHHPHPTGG